MAIADVDGLTVVLRALVYLGTVLVAGAVLFRATFSGLTTTNSACRWQLGIGVALLIICEPFRYLLFQLQISGGDLAMALSPSMRWIGMDTPLGRASAVRLVALVVILAAGLRWRGVRVAAALAMVGAYLLEGHTVSSDHRAILAPLLYAHLLAVHWWIGALPLLYAATTASEGPALARSAKRFGEAAVWGVAMLTAVGAILLGTLTAWQLDPGNAYHQAFLIKLSAFAAIFLTAAINKLRLTRALAQNPESGRIWLRKSLLVEMAIALTILIATALATSFSPISR